MSVDLPDPVTLQNLPGVWQRRSIRWPDGRQDTTTRVFWVQSAVDYADLRIPADRPSFSGCRSLADCSPDELRWLATQEGFAGTLIQRPDGAFNWRREIDFQPPTNSADVGRLCFTDASQRQMIEDGVEAPYVEVWERPEAPSNELPPAVLRLRGQTTHRGLIVAAGGTFLFALDRRPNLPAASSLNDLLDKTPADENVERLLDMELSFGIRDPDPAKWIITLSTLPWREGELVFGSDKEIGEYIRSAFS